MIRRGLTACRLIAADGQKLDAKPHLAKAAVCAKLILAILTESLLGRVLMLSPKS